MHRVINTTDISMYVFIRITYVITVIKLGVVRWHVLCGWKLLVGRNLKLCGVLNYLSAVQRMKMRVRSRKIDRIWSRRCLGRQNRGKL